MLADVRLGDHVDRLLARLPDGLGERGGDALRRVAIASDFAAEVFARQPEVLARLIDAQDAPALPLPALVAGAQAEWPALLRRYRTAESARLVWRDVLGLDSVGDTLAATTRLAEDCLQLGLAALEEQFEQRHGRVRDADGRAVRLVVYALGKLGGGELNFSSDVDLVYAYAAGGESDGARPLAAEDYFARLGQALARLLDEPTGDGFCHRVDLRLRPFGNAGRIALSFAAMELYFQREGRDWERYAWQKARPVAGDIAAGEAFLATLRPFVYRRYLDYGALEGLRDMKQAIAAEVARKDLADDIKRGPGGIREIEFLVQALQLIRGGHEPALRGRRLLPMLEALCASRQVAPQAAADLADAYLFLRRVENRLQMLRDAQTHVLPDDGFDRLRVARGLGHDGWPALAAELEAHRARVAAEFDALLAQRRAQPGVDSDIAGYWRALPDAGTADVLAAAGYGDAAEVDAALRDFARSPSVRDLSDAARARLDRVMPLLLQASAPADRPLQAVRRLLALLHNILRRPSYLALLDEQPVALARLNGLVARSAFLAERVAAHPLLLDELLDARVEGPLPGRAQLDAACRVALQRDDIEAALFALNETRQALSFRIALATLDDRQPAPDSTRQLSWLADAVVAVVIALARREMQAAHGDIAGARFAAIGYGSLGGEELGIGSDLDLVFLYEAPADAHSDGARSVDAGRWFARLAQKVVALLGTSTGAGRLYEVDVRLRPDGASGLLVSSLASYGEYQRTRAWTWEHQALVRARCVSGDVDLCAAFEHVRTAALAQPRDPAVLFTDVAAMRARMRGELDRGSAARFDLKQGGGGLVDLEFLLQALVLREAAARPALLVPRATPELIAACRREGLLDDATAAQLTDAHATLVAMGLACTLDRRARLVDDSPELQAARDAIRAATRAAGLAFG
ncbi:bifunctional [glutamate--ammonia ligase]-adenylyl-L-tyrosine phosphorylase/[glutamate--ammonia-ligase] adenylyltransferase [Luteimonas sp. MC1572]|uniref:bifunctional [glutamate--ammonia ligase]-adenylyl-L-tyrosine phosphorylase/[glutamate--ammonia-ligase] adenylyltransferase n=1 Tax=Luteimonas sp. MC1572 TaxID=2799325 RepID=UPI0018F0B264|nr:bifunctional [glutamate--ammonia ligase]-adenylyl-L-tyrosine phosphorylase/[glutamate--ammonia-ligase] adenylyltransferase [Luteimonas sp. MC1572]MBJ6982325.1 bifunctional [glutamate--ammonia ligase]-adenylyl-L-tyrosine phosphorylase/[glutamate--ammonia-ligase] adenylyltransferase [Luteimonas sp. MC1572]QQO04470.1 bifunctional [glutamate--ammonia ligase]-adenylyl-L-tyrosine phosphorylase/[glutamate--ammonia-ligase] adenylyltransferase [Luteimonas sp. MC1572]